MLNKTTLAHSYDIEHFMYHHLEHPALRSNTQITLYVPKPRNRCYENCFVYKSIKLWKSLREANKSTTCYETKLFKTRVRKEMENNNINIPFVNHTLTLSFSDQVKSEAELLKDCYPRSKLSGEGLTPKSNAY